MTNNQTKIDASTLYRGHMTAAPSAPNLQRTNPAMRQEMPLLIVRDFKKKCIILIHGFCLYLISAVSAFLPFHEPLPARPSPQHGLKEPLYGRT